MSEIVVRRATSEDAAAIGRVSVRAWQVAYRGLIADEHLAALDESTRADGWRRTIDDGSAQVFVAVVDRGVVGFVCSFASRDEDASPGTGEVGAIYAIPEAWGHGVGRTLMERALAALAEEGCTEVTLWVLDGNVRAIRFYEQAGFHADGATKTDEPWGYPLDEVRYRRALDPT